MSRSLRAFAGAFLVLAALLAAARPALASYDPLGSGTAKLTLDRGFARFLGQNQLKLSASAPATRKGRALTLPVSGGKIDPTSGRGEVEAEGALFFEGAKRRLPLRQLTVRTSHAPLIAKVGGGQLKLATSAVLGSSRLGFGTEFAARKLKLTAKLATRLNKKLRPAEPFEAGQALGTLLTRTQPQLVTVLGDGRAALDFDPAFIAKLDSLFVSVSPVFPAEHVGAAFTFPIIVGGAIAPDASIGTLRTGGDVEFLQLGGGQVFWHEQWLDLGAQADSAEANIQPSPPYPGKQGRIGVLDLAPGAIASDPRARTITLSGAPLTLQAQAAVAFNQAFAQGKEVFSTGELLGTISFTAQGQ